MSRQAEAERERRARIITADGEFQASKRLAAAANVMARDPAALQLRLLQTVVEVAAEQNSTLVMPVPVELLRFFDKFTPSSSGTAGGPQDKADSESMGDFSDAVIENAEAPAAIGAPPEVPLDIPDVPAIPELSPEEKGEVGTTHHAARKPVEPEHTARRQPERTGATAAAAERHGRARRNQGGRMRRQRRQAMPARRGPPR